MSPVTWIVIGAIALVCVLGVIATIVVLMTHLRHLAGTLTTVREEVEPELERLREATAVVQTELERVREDADDLSASRQD